MTSVFSDELARRVLVCDGAMGTLLHDRGVGFDVSFDSICLTAPDLVRSLHDEYIAAGVDIIATNSFGANAVRLAAFGLSGQCRLINNAAAALARQAQEDAGRDVFVAGTIGPTGSALQLHGGMTAEKARDAYGRQVEGLLEGGVDLFILETFSDPAEIGLAIAAIREQTELPVVAQMTFRADGTTATGATPEAFLDSLAAWRVEVVGANCSVGPDLLQPVLKRMATRTSLLLSAMPNAGLPRQVEGRFIYDISPGQFAVKAQELLALGVRLIGGCCGTTPEHIRQLVASIPR